MLQQNMLTKINERNRDFWMQRMQRLHPLFGDYGLCVCAFKTMQTEVWQRKYSTSSNAFEDALEVASNMKSHFVSEQARTAGKAPKKDALTLLIEDIARALPEITGDELLDKLRSQQHAGVIVDIDGDSISYQGKGEQLKDAPLSGLKDRLSRAKKRVIAQSR